MKKIWLLGLLMVGFGGMGVQAQKTHSRLVKWENLQALLEDSSDSLTVLNFWATWCKPCILELPHFEKARKAFANRPVRFRYISLDFASDKETRLDPFIRKKLPGATVWLLDETDYNTWINKVEPSWGGAIPVTLFVNNPKKIRIFAGQTLGELELFGILEKHLPNKKN